MTFMVLEDGAFCSDKGIATLQEAKDFARNTVVPNAGSVRIFDEDQLGDDGEMLVAEWDYDFDEWSDEI